MPEVSCTAGQMFVSTDRVDGHKMRYIIS